MDGYSRFWGLVGRLGASDVNMTRKEAIYWSTDRDGLHDEMTSRTCDAMSLDFGPMAHDHAVIWPCSDIILLQVLDSSYVYSTHNIPYVSMTS